MRLDWGLRGLAALSACQVQVIVDVLSFSTCIDVAVGRDVEVFPFAWKDERAAAFARDRGAVLASPDRRAAGPTLSPLSLAGLAPGSRLVLPSPNGSSLSAAATVPEVLAGCLRNASAVARRAAAAGGAIGIIAAGERWPDGSLRPSLEDLVGAGAIIARLGGSKSPEAVAAEAVCFSAARRIPETIAACASGRELINSGFGDDVAFAAEVDVSGSVPILRQGRYVREDHCGDMPSGCPLPGASPVGAVLCCRSSRLLGHTTEVRRSASRLVDGCCRSTRA